MVWKWEDISSPSCTRLRSVHSFSTQVRSLAPSDHRTSVSSSRSTNHNFQPKSGWLEEGFAARSNFPAQCAAAAAVILRVRISPTLQGGEERVRCCTNNCLKRFACGDKQRAAQLWSPSERMKHWLTAFICCVSVGRHLPVHVKTLQFLPTPCDPNSTAM